MKQHAKLSPSGAARWTVCRPSVLMETEFPDTTSQYAAEGTLAHAMAELKLTSRYLPKAKSKREAEHKAIKSDPLYQAEMETHTDEYAAYIEQIMLAHSDACIGIEQRLDIDPDIPECFGTADCVIVSNQTASGHGAELWVIDFKYGKNVEVDATDNAQMKLYAIGAVNFYQMLYGDIDVVNLVIIQPRMHNISEYRMSVNGLNAWKNNVVIPAAKEALAGTGDCIPGEHCIFCKAKPACAAYAEQFDISGNDKAALQNPRFLTPDRQSYFLSKLADMDGYYKALKELALTESLDGVKIPGYKAVEGRSVREWTDQQEAFSAAVQSGLDEEMLYERKPLTLSAIEKMTGKKQFAEIFTDYVHKPQGKPTLVLETDKRPVYQKKVSEFDNIQI